MKIAIPAIAVPVFGIIGIYNGMVVVIYKFLTVFVDECEIVVGG